MTTTINRRGSTGALLLAGVALLLNGCSDDNDHDTRVDDGEPGGASRTAVIQTADGPVQGKLSDDVSQFLGIPFAAPPVGDLRWQPPQDPPPWQDTRDTTAYGDICAQTVNLVDFAVESQSEDCLYLNVFAPADIDASDERPVMVWIYGGGNSEGATNDYDGSKLVKQGDVIVVTIAYRLNVFGFFAHPAIDAEAHDIVNYGLMDQQAALRWVKNNIAAFGGDPGNVTIFGESAGGQDVLANMASPTAAGLFHRGIVESGAYSLDQPDLATSEANGQAFAESVGCDDQTAECLRALSVEQIQELGSGNRYSNSTLTVDGTILTQTVRAALGSGDFNQVPVINGANRDEGRFFVAQTEFASGTPLTADEYSTQVETTYGANAPQVLGEYPLSDFDSPSEALSAIQGDSRFICPIETVSTLLTAYVPVYEYEFADENAPSYSPPTSYPLGAYHTGELQYLFPLYRGATGQARPLDDEQSQLSDAMVSYWSTFADAGDPNSAAAPAWPAYDVNDPRIQVLVPPQPQTEDAATFRERHKCDFWDGFM
ncbi:carboxylesterase family protein [Salinisphaera sp. T31B1]|uniref:carboxylesterase/lipase family protein n=1 Tax=Salinisphaera sp. T31B1 TaxID=727963 RepID=UPI00333F6A95